MLKIHHFTNSLYNMPLFHIIMIYCEVKLCIRRIKNEEKYSNSNQLMRITISS